MQRGLEGKRLDLGVDLVVNVFVASLGISARQVLLWRTLSVETASVCRMFRIGGVIVKVCEWAL